MTGRERVLNALNHRQADRLPVDFGGTSGSGINVLAYADLLEYMGLDLDVRLFDPMLQLAVVDEAVKKRFHVDTDKLYRAKPKFGIPLYNGYKDAVQMDGRPFKVPVDYNPIDCGNRWELRGPDGRAVGFRSKTVLYYELAQHALEHVEDPEEIKDFKLNPYSEEELAFYRKQSAELRAKNGGAVICALGGSFRETPSDLRGYQNFMVDLAVNHELVVAALLDRLLESYILKFDQFRAAVGDNVDIIKITDDLAMNGRLLCSESTYRKLIKPRQKVLFDHIKKGTGYKIFLHCDGQITSIMPDLIEIGVDAINPVDINAGMDVAYLKKEFGSEMTFWGGLIEPANSVPCPWRRLRRSSNDGRKSCPGGRRVRVCLYP
jgi:uroporphyrinogen decarboxylase